jgi:RNA polymerase sigma-70 factor (ECF subfamily)
VIEGYTHKEIAKVLSISESTSKSQLFKAKGMLRKLLEKSMISR